MLNEVWSEIAAITSVHHYLGVSSTYLSLLVAKFTHVEVGRLLRDVLKRVSAHAAACQPGADAHGGGKADPEVQIALGRLVGTLLAAMPFGELFAIEPFVRILQLFDGDAAAANHRRIMDAFAKRGATTSDPMLINALMHVARCLHDSIDSLSFDDERCEIASRDRDLTRSRDHEIGSDPTRSRGAEILPARSRRGTGAGASSLR